MSSSIIVPRLVLIHGLFSSQSEFALLARVLRSRGVPFDCLAIPGYTQGSVVANGRWQNWVDAADRALDERYGTDQPIVVGGLCVGGAIAAALAARDRHGRICGLVMMSPTFAYDGWSIGRSSRLRSLVYRTGLDRWLSVAEREPYGIKDPKMRQRVLQEIAMGSRSAIGPLRLPLRGIHEAERLYAAVVPLLARLAVPLLVIHARHDEIATLGSVRRAIGQGRPLTRLLVLEDSYHMVTIDRERAIVAHALADFVGAPPSPRRPPMSDALMRAKAARLHRSACHHHPSNDTGILNDHL